MLQVFGGVFFFTLGGGSLTDLQVAIISFSRQFSLTSSNITVFEKSLI